MKQARTQKSEKLLSKEKNNIHSEELNASAPLDIDVRQKESMPIKKDDGGSTLSGINDNNKAQQGFLISGNTDARVFLMDQLAMSFIGSDPVDEKECEEIMKKAVSLLVGINPQDQVETMLAVQMLATHNLSMTLIREAHQSKNGIRAEMYTHLASKITRIFTSQVEALAKYQNKGRQRIVVEHVTVNQGGQAIVGSEITQGGGSKK